MAPAACRVPLHLPAAGPKIEWNHKEYDEKTGCEGVFCLEETARKTRVRFTRRDLARLLVVGIISVFGTVQISANDVRFTMVVSVASMMIWRLGFSYMLGIGFGMGAMGVWIAMIVDWVCRSAFFVGRFVSGKWKTKYKA